MNKSLQGRAKIRSREPRNAKAQRCEILFTNDCYLHPPRPQGRLMLTISRVLWELGRPPPPRLPPPSKSWQTLQKEEAVSDGLRGREWTVT